MIKKFRQHLYSVNESYFKHMKVAINVGLNMILGGLMALIHGLIPVVYSKVMLVIQLKSFMNLSINKDNLMITIT